MAVLSSFHARNARSENWRAGFAILSPALLSPAIPPAIISPAIPPAIISPAILADANPSHDRSAWYVERTVTGATSATTAASRWVRSHSCSMAAV